MSKIFGQNKILNHTDKINNWLKNETALVTFELHLTNACNNRCPKCSGWKGKDKKDSLTLEEATDYLTQMSCAGAKAVIFGGGGEPMVSPHFSEAIWHAKELGLDIGVMTNGLGLNKQKMKDILATCNFCRISVDAGTSEMYKKTHGMDKDHFVAVVNNIRHLVKMKKEMESNCDIGIAFLTGKETLEDMEEFAKLAVRLEVDYAQYRPFNNDMTDIEIKIKILRREYGKVITASWQKYSRVKDNDKRPYDKCHGVNFATVICADANVYVCCHMLGNKKYSLGDLRKDSFLNIWEHRQEVFDKIDFNDCPYFCRCDEFNRILFEIKKIKQHVNFL